MGNVFFHVDLDAFFASVEQHDNPELRGKPVIIGIVGKRSVVSTCSYEARKYGVHSAMPSIQAQRLCPNGIFISGHMHRYRQVSRQIMEIFTRFSPAVQQMSVDEAFLDMTGTAKLFGSPKEAAMLIKETVKKETGLTVSIGIARNKYVAKLASDYRKPDGLCLVSPGKEELFIDNVGLNKLWGIGKSTLSIINSKGFKTTQQIREKSLEELTRIFGNNLASYLYKAVRGIEPVDFDAEAKSHSLSTETTYIEDLYDEDIISDVLLEMSTELAFRALDEGVIPRTIGVKIRYNDFETQSVQGTPEEGVLNSSQIFEAAKKLFLSRWNKSRGIRLLGLGLYQTYKGDNLMQGELFNEENEKKRALDKTVRELAKKGYNIKKASNIKKPD